MHSIGRVAPAVWRPSPMPIISPWRRPAGQELILLRRGIPCIRTASLEQRRSEIRNSRTARPAALRQLPESEIRLRCHRHMEVEKTEIQVALGADHLKERFVPLLIAHAQRKWLIEALGIVYRNGDFQPLSAIDLAPTLHNVQLVRVRCAISVENGFGVEANRIDHQR